MEEKRSLDEIIRLIEVSKKSGLKSIKLPDILIEFKTSKKPKISAPLVAASVPDLKAEDLVKEFSPLDNMTDEEIKFYATPYYDELQALKQSKESKEEG